MLTVKNLTFWISLTCGWNRHCWHCMQPTDVCFIQNTNMNYFVEEKVNLINSFQNEGLSPSCIALSFKRFGSISWHSIWGFFPGCFTVFTIFRISNLFGIPFIVHSYCIKTYKSEKNLKTVKEPLKSKNREPFCRRAMHEGDIPSFLNKFIKFTFFLTVQFIFVFYFF